MARLLWGNDIYAAADVNVVGGIGGTWVVMCRQENGG